MILGALLAASTSAQSYRYLACMRVLIDGATSLPLSAPRLPREASHQRGNFKTSIRASPITMAMAPSPRTRRTTATSYCGTTASSWCSATAKRPPEVVTEHCSNQFLSAEHDRDQYRCSQQRTSRWRSWCCVQMLARTSQERRPTLALYSTLVCRTEWPARPTPSAVPPRTHRRPGSVSA